MSRIKYITIYKTSYSVLNKVEGMKMKKVIGSMVLFLMAMNYAYYHYESAAFVCMTLALLPLYLNIDVYYHYHKLRDQACLYTGLFIIGTLLFFSFFYQFTLIKNYFYLFLHLPIYYFELVFYGLKKGTQFMINCNQFLHKAILFFMFCIFLASLFSFQFSSLQSFYFIILSLCFSFTPFIFVSLLFSYKYLSTRSFSFSKSENFSVSTNQKRQV